MRRSLLVGLLLQCLVAAADADPAGEVIAALDGAPLLRGSFVQEKSLVGFTRPLVSQGTFLVLREHGVIWNTTRPFAAELVITAKRITTRDAEGHATLVLDLAAHPELGAIDQLLSALVGGELTTLARGFVVTRGPAPGDAWLLVLTPRDPRLAQAIIRIELEGDRYVRRIQIDEANGDRDVMRFAAHATGPPLTAAERAALE